MNFLAKLFSTARHESKLPFETLVGETLPCFVEPTNPEPVETVVHSIELCGYQHLLLVNGETEPVFVPILLAASRMQGEPDPEPEALEAFKEIATALAMESKVEERARNTPKWMQRNRVKRFERLMKRKD